MTFNAGFKFQDATAAGMGTASAVGTSAVSLADQAGIGPRTVAGRQNPQLIIEDGKTVAGLHDDVSRRW